MIFRKYIPLLLQTILLVFTCGHSQAFGIAPFEDQRQLAEAYLEEEINWIQSAAKQNKQTALRIRQTSSQLIEALAIWGGDEQLIFPDRDLATHIYDYIFLNNHQRLKKLLAVATPSAWERYDVNEESLFYCQRDTISVCLLVNTNELTAGLDTSKTALFSALFPPNRQQGTPWWPFILLTLLLAVSLVIWFRFLNRGVIASKTLASNTFRMGDMEIDPHRMSITRDDFTVHITARDLKLLTCLFEHPDEVLTKDKLYDAGWGRAFVASSRSLEQHIMTLRKKIDPERQRVSLIETVHGQGYRYPANRL